jgi:hypothetical protein
VFFAPKFSSSYGHEPSGRLNAQQLPRTPHGSRTLLFEGRTASGAFGICSDRLADP